jgi:hypothetical protein
VHLYFAGRNSDLEIKYICAIKCGLMINYSLDQQNSLTAQPPTPTQALPFTSLGPQGWAACEQ